MEESTGDRQTHTRLMVCALSILMCALSVPQDRLPNFLTHPGWFRVGPKVFSDAFRHRWRSVWLKLFCGTLSDHCSSTPRARGHSR